MTDQLYLGIDVGTGSARAGLFDGQGRMVGQATAPIQQWRPAADFVEQSSDDIWQACGQAVRQAVKRAGCQPDQVAGLAFDATCSLVVLDERGRPVTVSPTGRDEQNVVVWMDHRAIDQAQRINATEHAVLRHVGGTMSPEMEPPKLLWLKEHAPQTWQRAAHFFDLPDFLTYRATGDSTRSLCTTVCKWTYQGHQESGRDDSLGRWDDSFWRTIGLGDLVDERYQRIGQRIAAMGSPLAGGLTEKAATELGLVASTPVALSLIDAHAGGVGLLGAAREGTEDLGAQLALIGGTSSCHMALSPEPRFIPGVWGPFYSAMVPGLWLSEGGQSSTGSLVDHVIFSHCRSRELLEKADERDVTVYQLLNEVLDGLAAEADFPAQLTASLHVLPYFHGNRSPRADPTLRGMVTGLRLSDRVEELALLYLATIQAIAHGTRHIIDRMNQYGYAINGLVMCGGGTKNPVFLREHADVTGCTVTLPREAEAVLLGSAMLGALAAGAHESLPAAMAAMSGRNRQITPAQGAVRRFHDAKYRLFHRLYEDQLAYNSIMQQTGCLC
jgi:FGGY-family pentulose kinase